MVSLHRLIAPNSRASCSYAKSLCNGHFSSFIEFCYQSHFFFKVPWFCPLHLNLTYNCRELARPSFSLFPFYINMSSFFSEALCDGTSSVRSLKDNILISKRSSERAQVLWKDLLGCLQGKCSSLIFNAYFLPCSSDTEAMHLHRRSWNCFFFFFFCFISLHY